MQLTLDLADFSSDFAAHLFHPRVGLDLGDGWALGWIELEDVDDEALEFLAEVAAELVVAQPDFFPHFLHALGRERSKAMQKFVEEYAKRPHVYAVVVLLLKDHLRSHVLISAAEGLALHLDVVGGPAEIADLDVQGMIEQYVLRLH